MNLNKASRVFGYTQDYLGQLIRGGKIGGTRRGREWFIEISELEKYIKSKSKEAKTAEAHPRSDLSKRRILLPFSVSLSRGAGVVFAALALFSSGAFAADGKGIIKDVADLADRISRISMEALGATPEIISATNDFLYTSSFDSGQTVKVSYVSVDNSTGKFFYDIYSDLASNISGELARLVEASAKRAAVSDFSLKVPNSASIFDPFVSVFKSGGQAYQSTNKKITSFFGNAYLKVVETVIPGLALPNPLAEEGSPSLAEELKQTQQELEELKESIAQVPVQRAEPTEPIEAGPPQAKGLGREIAQIVIKKSDDTKLLTIQGDVLKIQTDLSRVELDLASLQNSVNPNLTNSRL
ncbi:MAG: helix-turn-helix domain-containing protein, partial [Candidatus Spechtbacterales bacterium]